MTDQDGAISRRTMLARASLGIACAALLPISESCSSVASSPSQSNDNVRLASRPIDNPSTITPGLYSLNLASRDAELFVPRTYDGKAGVPLLVLLHGAGRDATEWTSPQGLRDLLDEFGIAMLAPSSRGGTWNAAPGDVAFIDSALRATFQRLRVDGKRIGMGGFSDGASYGMSLALANGDFVARVLGYSMGYLLDFAASGKPKVFMSHGTADPILPYAGAVSIASTLRARGYDVNFVTHEGGHTIGLPVARQSFTWFLS